MQQPHSIMHVALDNNRDIATQVGLLLSCYALIEQHMFVVFERLSGKSRGDAEDSLGNVSDSYARMNVLRQLLDSSNDNKLDKELSSEIFDRVEECCRIRNKYAHSFYSQMQIKDEEEWCLSSWFGDVRKINIFEYISLDSIKHERNILRQTIRDLNYFGKLSLPGIDGVSP